LDIENTMESKIASALHLKYGPVALLWSDERPKHALQFGKGKRGCVMALFANAAKGKTAVFDRETYGCWGGGVGLGFGNQYLHVPGGMECFYHFLSTGIAQWSDGKEAGKKVKGFVPKSLFGEFLEGERYLKSPDLVKKFVERLPITEIPSKFVVLKPLQAVDADKENLATITFLVTPDQLAALVVLANYGRDHDENVTIPYAAACQAIGIFSYKERASKKQRAVVGLNDMTARKYLKKYFDDDLMSFSVPSSMFQEMEDNVTGSFLGKKVWANFFKGNKDHNSNT
jgi:uncharacterized protein (DUF169 family)